MKFKTNKRQCLENKRVSMEISVISTASYTSLSFSFPSVPIYERWGRLPLGEGRLPRAHNSQYQPLLVGTCNDSHPIRPPVKTSVTKRDCPNRVAGQGGNCDRAPCRRAHDDINAIFL